MLTANPKGLSLAIAALSVGIATAGYGNSAEAACSHVISNEWSSGYTAAIRITNDTNAAISGWNVSWQYNSNRVTSSWNANLSGSNPYTASDVGWNGSIQPGQTVEFGFQVDKNGGSAESPTVTGSVCGTGGNTSSAASSTVSSAASSTTNNNSGGQCNWYGTLYPLCSTTQSGWGWEQNQSCISLSTCSTQPAPYGPVNGNNSSVASSTPSSVASSSAPSSVASSSAPSSVASSAPSSVASSEASSTPSSVASSSSSSIPGTAGRWRVNESGKITRDGTVFPVQCGAWFGLEGQHEPKDAENNPNGAPLEMYVGNMWWADTGRTIQQTMSEIKDLGINVIRVPIAPQTLDPNDPQGIGDVRSGGVLKNHESVRQTNARQALEDFIKLADQNDLQVIIDIHSCSNYVGWRAGRLDANPPYVDATREGYDYTREEYSCGGGGEIDHPYNEQIWLENLRTIAGFEESLGVDNILGIDIFNEPWDYTWDEWATLAEKAYRAINEVNQNVLVVVEGVGSVKSDGTEVDHGSLDSNPNWGENLYGFATRPLDIPKERLVLSPHVYGPSVFVQSAFLTGECAELEGDDAGRADCQITITPSKLAEGWQEHFGYLRDQGYAMIVGEFGGNMDWPRNTRAAEQEMWSHITTNVDEQWQNAFVDYMIEKDIEACYWSINPESADTGGLYEHSYVPDVNESGWGTWLNLDTRKTSLLQRLWNGN
ncbi:MAG: cellulase family glycosylhydrolase [Cellvibrio sp.]|jgi:Endoglucanase